VELLLLWVELLLPVAVAVGLTIAVVIMVVELLLAFLGM